jgi:hypothetical protein
MIVKKIVVTLAVLSYSSQLSALTFHKSAETLHSITSIINKEQKGAYLRFGDGDVNLARGENELLQSANSKLSVEMREAFALSGPTILKSLPLHCREFGGYEPGMFPGNHEWTYDQSVDLLNKITPYWHPINDVYAQAALHYTACYQESVALRFLNFLSSKNILIVGNKNIPKEIRDLLFSQNRSFIGTPDRQSYTDIDRIEAECMHHLKNQNGYTVVIIAMGCSGRVLQKRLWQSCDNLFLFDFGSLMDALCGWDTRAWISLSNFDATQFKKKINNKIKVLYTAALQDFKFESRKKEYCKSLTILNSFGYYPLIAEALGRSNSFLDDFSKDVFYAASNDNSLHNKGANEVRLLRASMDHFAFNDQDMIVKLTGRYYFEFDDFFKEIESNPDVDLFIRYDKHGQAFTGCFAMRAKYLKQFIFSLNIEKMEKNMINIELLLRDFINQLEQNISVKTVSNLNLVANIFGSGEECLTYW